MLDQEERACFEANSFEVLKFFELVSRKPADAFLEPRVPVQDPVEEPEQGQVGRNSDPRVVLQAENRQK